MKALPLIPAVLLGTFSLLLTACDVSSSVDQMAAKNPDARARHIAAQYGCMGCHTVENSVMGPAWRMVSQSYQAEPDGQALIKHSILHGSRGRWQSIAHGQVMPAFHGRMSDEEANILASYIFGLAHAAKQPPK